MPVCISLSAIYVWLCPKVFVCFRVIQRVSLFALDQILSFELNTLRGRLRSPYINAQHAGGIDEIVGQSLPRLANKTEKGSLPQTDGRFLNRKFLQLINLGGGFIV
jgi:hypothetical protein